MFTNLKSTCHGVANRSWAMRKALLATILAGATLFSAPTTGCDPAGLKDASGSSDRIIIQPPPANVALLNLLV